MITVYIYLLATMADWETGYITAELNSGRFFAQNAPKVTVKTVGYSLAPVKTMGGLTITPDCVIDDIVVNETTVLILPGANTWNEPMHAAIIQKAGALLNCGATVCAICGATTALASAGFLDTRPHTSNGVGFLDMFVPDYKGQKYYVDELSVADNNLITAGSTGGLLWARQIIEHLGVFTPETTEAWYNYFSTGKSEHFFALMQSVQTSK